MDQSGLRVTSHMAKKKEAKNFRYAHFRIPLYKYPVSSLFEIFVPLAILAALNLATFYQDSNVLADKIASIATVTLALIAFIPTINSKIPPTKSFKLIEFIIYLQVFTTFLNLIDSLSVRKNSPGAYETSAGNGFFLVSLLVNIACGVVIIVQVVLHKFWWEELYLKSREEKCTGRINKNLWNNNECDK